MFYQKNILKLLYKKKVAVKYRLKILKLLLIKTYCNTQKHKYFKMLDCAWMFIFLQILQQYIGRRIRNDETQKASSGGKHF